MAIFSLDSLDKGYKMAAGVHTTVAAIDTVTTGLSSVVACFVSIASTPDDDLTTATAAASGGTLTIKTWKNASSTDGTPVAATSFTKTVHWLAIGS